MMKVGLEQIITEVDRQNDNLTDVLYFESRRRNSSKPMKKR